MFALEQKSGKHQVIRINLLWTMNVKQMSMTIHLQVLEISVWTKVVDQPNDD